MTIRIRLDIVNHPAAYFLVCTMKVRQWFGEAAGARRPWAADDDLLPERGPAEQVTFAKVLLASGKPEQAVTMLERLLAQTESRGWLGQAIELRVQLALALVRTGQRERAITCLAEGLVFAAHQGFVREFVEGKSDIFGLLRDVVRSRLRVDREFVTRLLAHQPTVDPLESYIDQRGISEALTDRQLDVLRILAAGRSNRLIAEELFLAEGTVKAHFYQISAKLLARNRTEAVARARELGLLG